MPSPEADAALDQLSIRARRYIVEAFKAAPTIDQQFHARNVGKEVGISDAKSRELVQALTAMGILATTVYGDRQIWTPLGLEVAALLADRRLTGKVDTATLEALQLVQLTPKEERLLLILLDRSKPNGIARILPRNFETPEGFSVEETDEIVVRLSQIGPFPNGHRILTFNRKEIYLDPEAETLAQIIEDRRNAADYVVRDKLTGAERAATKTIETLPERVRPLYENPPKMTDDERRFFLTAWRRGVGETFDWAEVAAGKLDLGEASRMVSRFRQLRLWRMERINAIVFTPEGKRLARDLEREEAEAAEAKTYADEKKAVPMTEAEKTLLVELWRKSSPFGNNRMVPRPIDTVVGFSRDGLDDALKRLHGRGLLQMTSHEIILLPDAEAMAKDFAKEPSDTPRSNDRGKQRRNRFKLHRTAPRSSRSNAWANSWR